MRRSAAVLVLLAAAAAAGGAAGEAPRAPVDVRLEARPADTAVLVFDAAGEGAAAAEFVVAFWRVANESDRVTLFRTRPGEVALPTRWDAEAEVAASVRAASAAGEFSEAALPTPESVLLAAPGEGGDGGDGGDGGGGGGGAFYDKPAVKYGAAAAVAAVLACGVCVACRRCRRGGGGPAKAGGGASAAASSSGASSSGASAGAKKKKKAAGASTGGGTGPYSRQVDDELELELELGLDPEDAPTLDLSSLMEPEYDSAWFQERWERAPVATAMHADLVGHRLIDTGALEEALEAKNFRVVASGSPFEQIIKVYFFGKPGGSDSDPVLAEMVVDTESLTMDVTFKSPGGPGPVKQFVAAFRRAMDLMIAKKGGARVF